MIKAGIEYIDNQKDTLVVQECNLVTQRLIDTVRLDVSNHSTNSKLSIDEYLKYKNRVKKNLLINDLSKLSDILSNRFGFTITVNNITLRDFKISSIVMPNINSRTLNTALTNIESMFPSKQLKGMLWSSIASTKEQAVYNTLNSVKSAIESDKFKINFKRAKVSGLNNENFILNIDLLGCLVLDLTNEEITTIILYEIGRIFIYLEYMFTSNNNTFSLLDSFIKNKYVNDKEPIEALTISLETESSIKDNKNKNTIGILNELDIYILKTFRYDKSKGSINIDYQRGGDIFVTRFGIGEILSTALAKRATSGTVDFSRNDSKSFGAKVISTTLNSIIIVMVSIITVLFLAIGMLLFLVYVAIKIIDFIVRMILKTILNSLYILIKNDGYKHKTFDDVIKRIRKIKLDMIRELRTTEISEDNSKYILKQIDDINMTITTLGNTLGSMNKYGYIPSDVESVNDMLEELEENELHLYGAKFGIL